MPDDVIFQPLKFKNLTVKNRIFRSNISGRFDNYDGSGNQARINWEVKFASGGVGAIISSFVPVHLRGRIMPNYATIDTDERSRSGGSSARRSTSTTASTSCSSAMAAGSATCPASSTRRPELHGQAGSAARVRVQAHDRRRHQGDGRRLRRRRPPRARGGPRRRRAARRERLPDHAVPELRDQRPHGRIRRAAREPRALRRSRSSRRSGRRVGQRLPPADEDQRRPTTTTRCSS